MQNTYCSMIHGGLELNFKLDYVSAQHCCLRDSRFKIDPSTNFWNDQRFNTLRNHNLSNQWDANCSNCLNLEKSGQPSFRTGMNQGLEIFGQTKLSGPARIDLLFDISCNLACRTCDPSSSTFWQKHLKQNNLWSQGITAKRNKDQVIQALQQLDLSQLRQVVFCGGETLMGQEYWQVSEWLANNVPDAKTHLTLCFQTNGTQTIEKKHYPIIDKFHMVKLHVSLDGIEQQFDYLRWPASWQQVVDNIQDLKQNLPGNVMFVVEETVSIFNLAYLDRLQQWTEKYFVKTREGDPINHTKHMAHGIFSLKNCSEQYVQAMQNSVYKDLVPRDWKENTLGICAMIKEIKKFDAIRNQSFYDTFPVVAEYYSKFW